MLFQLLSSNSSSRIDGRDIDLCVMGFIVCDLFRTGGVGRDWSTSDESTNISDILPRFDDVREERIDDIDLVLKLDNDADEA